MFIYSWLSFDISCVYKFLLGFCWNPSKCRQLPLSSHGVSLLWILIFSFFIMLHLYVHLELMFSLSEISFISAGCLRHVQSSGLPSRTFYSKLVVLHLFYIFRVISWSLIYVAKLFRILSYDLKIIYFIFCELSIGIVRLFYLTKSLGIITCFSLVNVNLRYFKWLLF